MRKSTLRDAHARVSTARDVRMQLYKNNARALLSRILSVLNLDWLQHAQSVRGVYEKSLIHGMHFSFIPNRHNWNLNNVSNNTCNVLHVLPNRMGITSPELKLGMLYSTEAWNCDRHSLPLIDYLHSGAPKIW